ncbi:immunoglobulin domain-containing protein isoform X2 [Polyodon spathula]|uniref:immunoglobulin domain-containing protein isoform X2 n=1 Tax=Polyodon spathula TaxID=7913 RepID=UPI001B7F569B|nr:immunoglobulin domain-containing protein isoform X2 [Polyodon spathula]
MSGRSASLMLVLVFLQSGSSNTKIEIRRSDRIEPGERLRLSCSLLGQDRITQINWIRVRGSNATVLAVYHPVYGSSVTDNDSSVSLQRDSESQVTLIVSGPDRDWNQTVQYCCRFITFPSGTMEDCINAEAPEEPSTDALSAQQSNWILIGTGVLLAGCLLTVTGVALTRRRVYRKSLFKVEQSFVTDSEESGEFSEVSASEQPDSTGSKVYVMINADYYLFQAARRGDGLDHQYDNRKVPPSGEQTNRMIYYLLWEKVFRKELLEQ